LGDTDAALDLLERILPKAVKSFKSGSGTTPTSIHSAAIHGFRKYWN